MVHQITCGYRGLNAHVPALATEEAIVALCGTIAANVLREHQEAGVAALVTVERSNKRGYYAMVRIQTPVIIPRYASLAKR